MNITKEELSHWKYQGFADSIRAIVPTEIREVRFFLTTTGTLQFFYKNGSGLLFPDNGYLGEQPDGRNYYPLLKLCPSYSHDGRFGGNCGPTLAEAADAVRKSWAAFVA